MAKYCDILSFNLPNVASDPLFSLVPGIFLAGLVMPAPLSVSLQWLVNGVVAQCIISTLLLLLFIPSHAATHHSLPTSLSATLLCTLETLARFACPT